ncbi:helix-turn-helix domain-containing protein [Kribbella sp. NPDC058245]|uniref:helix-turn-helix domain-containing protein n=1 Tax=Kribbella sp. NPDC058245 TaxID=3346399 RepID=UPI0036E37706
MVVDGAVDATITLRGPREVVGVLDVVVKRWTTAPSSAVIGVLAGEQRRATNPLLLMTDYTNGPLRRACEELGISYVDESGWVFLKVDDPPILVRTEGAERSQPRVNNEVTRLNGVAVGRVLRTLLETQPPIGVRELAERASVKSPGSVSKLLPTLVAAGAVERDQHGRIVVIRQRALLERWTQDYSYLNGNGVVLDYLAPRGLPPVLAQLSSLSKVCATGSFAGNEYLGAGTVPVVPATRLSLYAQDPRELAVELGLVRVDRQSSNVIVAAPRDQQLIESPRHRNHLPLAPLPQVLADLLTLPGRESLLADQLMDQLAQSDPAWSA